jgi:hypothetical protein
MMAGTTDSISATCLSVKALLAIQQAKEGSRVSVVVLEVWRVYARCAGLHKLIIRWRRICICRGHGIGFATSTTHATSFYCPYRHPLAPQRPQAIATSKSQQMNKCQPRCSRK